MAACRRQPTSVLSRNRVFTLHFVYINPTLCKYTVKEIDPTQKDSEGLSESDREVTQEIGFACIDGREWHEKQ